MARKEIIYNWGKDYLLIDLGNRIQNRIRLLFIAEFLFIAGIATCLLLIAIPVQGNFTHFVMCIGATITYMLAAYRFLSRLFFNESLYITTKAISIHQQSPFYRSTRTFNWQSISEMHYIGKPHKTDHPLKGNSFDYFGFESQEQLIQRLHHKGNLYFSCEDENIYFARGVYFWDAEKTIRMIKLYAGHEVKLDDELERMVSEPESENE
jgi:hypothetical protein